MRILICGDRNWTDREAIWEYLDSIPAGSVIIEGDARGADRIAGDIAAEMGFEVEVYPAQWDRYGRAAGPIRNTQMLDEGKPVIVVYCHDDLDNSKGTKNMVTQATKLGLLCRNVRWK
ncbi:hypothetical protein LCGC14_0264590 [marine sediment metagenome]|uniref:YspA cpYpsA-related SLOG domain-containing protein n=1 Tax=marine sediment metagenome TaxID=412755 RepID=A0A0F9WLI6_9ZZZZ